MTADELWKGVLAESGSGGRKGRGKRTKRKLKRDLNRGQRIGEGKTTSCIFVTVLVCLLRFMKKVMTFLKNPIKHLVMLKLTCCFF